MNARIHATGCKSHCAVLFYTCMAIGLAYGQNMGQMEAAAQQAAQDNLFAGMIHVTQGDTVTYSKGFGSAMPELGVTMRNDHRYPIGSNTKLFTSVAIWQLHKAGKLNAYDPVVKYMSSSELGLTGPWCPRAHNASKDGPCQVPQIQHLLRMSGGVLGFDNCAYPDDAWQQQYCLTGPKIGAGLRNMSTIMNGQQGAVSMADYLKASGVLTMPLDFAPGSSYHYSNPGYSLAGYVVEKVSGMPLADYFKTYIFAKAGMSSTIYDITNGAMGLHKNTLPYPAYISYLTPATNQLEATFGIDSLNDLTDSIGSLKSWHFGDVNNKTLVMSQPAAVLNPSAQPAGVYAFTAKYPGPSNFDWTMANAAGAMVSTPQDMAKWFRVLVTQPEQLGLSKEILKSMLQLTTVVPGVQTIGNVTWLFAQGVIVVPDATHPRGLGVSHLYYVGSLGGFRAVPYLALDRADPAKDVFVNVLVATVLPDVKTWPAGIGFSSSSKCVYAAGAASNSSSSSGLHQSTSKALSAGRRRLLDTTATGSTAAAAASSVPSILCEVKDIQPEAMRALDSVLVMKAVTGVTGRNWFGLP